MNHSELNGYQVHGFFKSGAYRLHRLRQGLDAINVFPVADRDTGSNMAFTMVGAVEMAVPQDSAAKTLVNLSEAALESARGNSGVILAQFLSGLSEVASSTRLKSSEFVAGVELACERAREAMANPQEGTMLSVMKAWSLALRREHRQSRSFDELFQAAKPDLEKSLESTRGILPEMQRAGVVDAGASGFVEFIEGAHEFFRYGQKFDLPNPKDRLLVQKSEIHDHGAVAPKFRYCTETMVRSAELDRAGIRHALEGLGDSLIVAGQSGRCRVHIHTDHPEQVMERLEILGQLSRQKVDDMQRQFEDGQATMDISLVTDSACDLPTELLDRYHIHVVPLLLTSAGTEYLDKLTISQDGFWRLAAERATFPRSSQPSVAQLVRMYESQLAYGSQVVSIHVAGVMSGTFQAAQIEARRLDPDRIRVVDSKGLSASFGLLVLRVAEARDQGMSLAELTENIPLWASKARIFVSVPSLSYMVRGGRVSPLKGWLAGLLNLKPIVSVDAEGRSLLYGKSFSEQANLRKLIAMTIRIHQEKPILYYAVVHAAAPEKASRLARELEAALGFPPHYIMEISSVIALNSGPGAVSVALMSR